MAEPTNRPDHVAFVGFGEAGTAFVTGWDDARPADLRAFDIKTDATETRQALLDRYQSHRISGHENLNNAVAGVTAVFCVVTADQAFAAAEAASRFISPGTLWFDCNSCSPGAKLRSAKVIHEAGGRYVDVAVMSPVWPKRHHVPLLISGPHTEEADAVLRALDMKPRQAGAEIGRASSIKMLRSVMIKGLEALTAECFLAARRAGVEEEVIGSLEVSDPDIKWRERGTYNLERMMVHGARRAAEMKEVAITVEELGLGGEMAAAAALWQQAIADIGADPGEPDLYSRLDTVLSRLDQRDR